MRPLTSWRGEQLQVAESTGGTLAVTDPWQNVIRTNIDPWPAPELIQKIYQSRQVRAFSGDDLASVTKTHGFYSDLQSLHSEDSITWSVFGPVIYADRQVRIAFVGHLLKLIGISVTEPTNARIWLWRRLPHPDTLVSGGPEIDFGIQTDDVFLLGEAKWRSSLAANQGINRDKNQLTLRREFCQKYGARLMPNVKQFVVLGISREGGMLPKEDSEADGIGLHLRDSTWEKIAAIGSHPCGDEVRCYLKWKVRYSKH